MLKTSDIRLLVQRFVATFRGRHAEADLSREIQAHLQLMEDRFVAEGMSVEDARNAARRAFGNVELTKELQRDARSFRWLTGWTMELRLGARMLVRYPGLTVVGGLAMAFAILMGAGVFEVIKRATAPDLPLPEGEGIVGLTYWDSRENERKPTSAYDFLTWREELTTLQDVGAFRLVERNLAVDGGMIEPVMVAEISPAAFRVARVPPLLGRVLVESDEKAGSPPVVVLGYRLWQTRFGGSRAVVGRTVRLGGLSATVAGVMPKGFGFPVDDNLWVPLHSGELAREPGVDPVKVFGRLVPGVTLREAQAEVAVLEARRVASFPDRYARLTPQVLPYANSILWLPPDLFVHAGIQSINLFAAGLLIVVCGNVALLMLTRTATREREIVVRTALGATRGRILAQLLLESLLLAGIALVVGLAAANWQMQVLEDMLRAGPERWPFWLNAGLSASTVAYAAVLTLVAAVIVGVLPGWKVIGLGMADRLRMSSAGGGGLGMGKLWTGLVVTQVAATVLFSAIAYVVHRQAEYLASVETVFPTAKYLSVRVQMEPEGTDAKGAGVDAAPKATAQRQQLAAAVLELERQLSVEAGVDGVTVAEQLPLMATPTPRSIEVNGASPMAPKQFPKVSTSTVAANLFTVFQMPLLAGRTFDSRDRSENANTVIVNDVFVERILGGRNAIGQQIRYHSVAMEDQRAVAKVGPWLEIIGVVRDLAPASKAPLNLDNPVRPRIYHLLNANEGRDPLFLAVRAKGDPELLGPTLRRVAGVVSPKLQLHEIQPLDHAVSEDTRFWRGFANGFLAGNAVVLLLSLACIYSVTSYTVARSKREIGVRVALGAPAPRVLATLFRRPLLQVAGGIGVGCGLLAVLVFARNGVGVAMVKQGVVILGYGIVAMGVCMLACIGPALRALRVDPVEALRDDA